MLRFGAIPAGDGRVEFRVWAPNASSVSVRTDRDTPLDVARGGVHEGFVAARPGDDYLFVLDGERELPDPCSRFQPEGINGPSRIVDTSRYGIAAGPKLRLEELVLYELHVGTFSAEGTCDGVVSHLRGLKELGVTAIELGERLPGTLLIAEQEVGNLRPIEEWGFDAQWADEFHHELHVALTGERHGYYGRYGSLASLASLYERPAPERRVFCSQNHDQVGNRAHGDRPQPDELELRAAALLFAPETPLLFMGEEYGERRPFQYFTDHADHADPLIADATREGRRREFAFAGDVPDTQDPATFERSKLSREERPGLRRLYVDLLRLRRELPREVTARADEDARILRIRRGEVELVADFGNRTVDIRR